jgi:hypothetical protein
LKYTSIAVGLLLLGVSLQSFSSACDDVYLITFDAELYAPESEATIESKAFEKKLVSSSLVDKLANSSEVAERSSYREGNTRAMISHDGRKIYIDRYGVVRDGTTYFKIDPRKFERNLSAQCID